MAWHEWHPEAGTIIGIACAAAWYFVGVRRYLARSTHGHRLVLIRARYYAAALAVLAIALASPLDAAADALFSMHMVQHLLLILVAAPLVAMSAPAAALWWGAPAVVRRPADRLWARSPHIRLSWRAATAPANVLAIHIATLWFWHFPGPYQAALRNEWIHAFEHISFLGTAILFWWVVLQPVGHRRISRAGAGAFLMIVLLQGGLLGALLVFAGTPWYPAHAADTARWGADLLGDQQLAGLLMWIPASVAYLGAIAYLAVKAVPLPMRSQPARS